MRVLSKFRKTIAIVSWFMRILRGGHCKISYLPSQLYPIPFHQKGETNMSGCKWKTNDLLKKKATGKTQQ